MAYLIAFECEDRILFVVYHYIVFIEIFVICMEFSAHTHYYDIQDSHVHIKCIVLFYGDCYSISMGIHGIVTIIRTTTMMPSIAAQASWLDGLFHSTVGIMQLFTIGVYPVEIFLLCIYVCGVLSIVQNLRERLRHCSGPYDLFDHLLPNSL